MDHQVGERQQAHVGIITLVAIGAINAALRVPFALRHGVEDRHYRVLAAMGCLLNYATLVTFCLLPSAGLPLTDFPCGSFGFAFFLLTTYALSIREGGWIKAFLIAIPVCLLAAIASYLLGCLHGNDCDLMWTLQPSYEECQTIPGLKWILQQSCLEHETRAKTYPAPMLFASDI